MNIFYIIVISKLKIEFKKRGFVKVKFIMINECFSMCNIVVIYDG